MALEWLKGILGDAYTADIDTAVSAEIGKGFVAKSDFNTTNEAKKAAEALVETRDKKIAEMKKVDTEGMQSENEQLKKDNATLKQASAIDAELYAAGAVNVTAVKAVMDMSGIKEENGKYAGIKEAVAAAKTANPWGFPQQTVPGAGGNPPPLDQASAEEAKMRAAAGLPVSKTT